MHLPKPCQCANRPEAYHRDRGFPHRQCTLSSSSMHSDHQYTLSGQTSLGLWSYASTSPSTCGYTPYAHADSESEPSRYDNLRSNDHKLVADEHESMRERGWWYRNKHRMWRGHDAELVRSSPSPWSMACSLRNGITCLISQRWLCLATATAPQHAELSLLRDKVSGYNEILHKRKSTSSLVRFNIIWL
jgi:hypothetical protein